MFYWLIELSNTFPPGFGWLRTLLNVFRYITFRTGGAVVTGALFVFLFGPGSSITCVTARVKGSRYEPTARNLIS